MDVLTTYTHNLELQAITVLPLISSIQKSPQPPLSIFQSVVPSPAVAWQLLLTLEILHLHALKFSLHSLTYRTFSTDYSLAYSISAQTT
jgi:hypothetical protein